MLQEKVTKFFFKTFLIIKGKLETVKYLIEKGADPNY